MKEIIGNQLSYWATCGLGYERHGKTQNPQKQKGNKHRKNPNNNHQHHHDLNFFPSNGSTSETQLKVGFVTVFKLSACWEI